MGTRRCRPQQSHVRKWVVAEESTARRELSGWKPSVCLHIFHGRRASARSDCSGAPPSLSLPRCYLAKPWRIPIAKQSTSRRRSSTFARRARYTRWTWRRRSTSPAPACWLGRSIFRASPRAAFRLSGAKILVIINVRLCDRQGQMPMGAYFVCILSCLRLAMRGWAWM